MSIYRRSLLSLIGAVLALWLGACAKHIQDLAVTIDPVTAASAQKMPSELAYYMDKAYSQRHDVVALPGAGNFRLPIGPTLDKTFQQSLAPLFDRLSVLPNDIYFGPQLMFDYPAYFVAEIRSVAINPTNQGVQLGVNVSIYIRGRRKIGEAQVAATTSAASLERASLSEADRKVLGSGDAKEIMALVVRQACHEVVAEFLKVMPSLVKVAQHKGEAVFVGPYQLPLTVDFKAGNPTRLVDTQSLNDLNRVVEVLEKNPALRLRVEVHAFDHLGQVGEFPPKILGPERAKVLRQFLEKAGISSSRIEAISHEEQFPVGDNRTQAGWDRNDRVDFVVLR
ncbi:MAG: OmpA family protein [Bdellovibrionota bacterium]